MARRPKSVDLDPFADLAKKIEILERELSVQSAALDRMKALATAPRKMARDTVSPQPRKNT